MRFYAFTNFYLSPLQKGIQAQHCTAELFTHYNHESAGGRILYEWANNHKTTIVLNGGNCADLNEIFLQLRALCAEPGYPYQSFSEDAASLNGAITCVGVIVPPIVYDSASLIREGTPVASLSGGAHYTFDNPITRIGEREKTLLTYSQYHLALLISQCGLAS